LFWKKYCQKLQLTWEGEVIYVFKSELFHFLTAQGDVLATSKPIGMSMWLGISFMLASYPKKIVYQIHSNLSSVLFLVRILYSGRAKVQCGGACWRSLTPILTINISPKSKIKLGKSSSHVYDLLYNSPSSTCTWWFICMQEL
jgi:hypothetical protein